MISLTVVLPRHADVRLLDFESTVNIKDIKDIVMFNSDLLIWFLKSMKKLNFMSFYLLSGCEVVQSKDSIPYGKDCPDNIKSKCLNENREYDSLKTAWGKCKEVYDCAFIMRYWNGKFLLRRESDPYNSGFGIWGYKFICTGKCRSLVEFKKQFSKNILCRS